MNSFRGAPPAWTEVAVQNKTQTLFVSWRVTFLKDELHHLGSDTKIPLVAVLVHKVRHLWIGQGTPQHPPRHRFRLATS